MYLLVPAHLGCPGQSPESRKMVDDDEMIIISGSVIGEITGHYAAFEIRLTFH